jgi:hypothetical protein
MHYDHRTRAARWGSLISYVLGLQHGNRRLIERWRVKVGGRPIPPDALLSDVRRALGSAIQRIGRWLSGDKPC